MTPMSLLLCFAFAAGLLLMTYSTEDWEWDTAVFESRQSLPMKTWKHTTVCSVLYFRVIKQSKHHDITVKENFNFLHFPGWK